MSFDAFTMKIYDNNKSYISLPWESNSTATKILLQRKEIGSLQDTGFINSFIITKMPVQSGTDIKTVVDSNVKNLQLKLLKYKNIATDKKKLKCNGEQYSWYILAFSYQLDQEVLYQWEYLFTDNIYLYIVSLSSDNQKDITSFIKSIDTVKCNK